METRFDKSLFVEFLFETFKVKEEFFQPKFVTKRYSNVHELGQVLRRGPFGSLLVNCYDLVGLLFTISLPFGYRELGC